MMKRFYVRGVVLIALGVGVGYADTNCNDFLSQYDCVYQHTLSGSSQPIDTCMAYSGCAYGSEFAVTTGTCDYPEFNETAAAFTVLYPNKSVEKLHTATMEQCKAFATTGDMAGCVSDCDAITTGSAFTACTDVCMYDNQFGASLAYMVGSCEDEAACVNACEEADYLTDHCTSVCATHCEDDVGEKGGSLSSKGYCGDGILSPYEECDDGNNKNGDGCDYNCHPEPTAATGGDDDGFDRDEEIDELRELLDTGEGDQGDSVQDQLSNATDAPAVNEDPKELPKAGAFKLDTLTGKGLLAISFLVMLGLLVARTTRTKAS